jgi:hypothetical protein
MTDDTELLRKISRNLDDIKAILSLAYQDKISDEKKELLKEGTVKLQVYNLCDGSNAIEDIARSLQKPNGYISSYITILRREGLIRVIEKYGKQVLEQTF